MRAMTRIRNGRRGKEDVNDVEKMKTMRRISVEG
jgi:hypothetical protein